MLAALVVVLRSLALLCCGHRAVALENLALRQQLAVFRRTAKRPPLRRRDRLFWILLANAWRDWRTALIVVQPDTVVRRMLALTQLQFSNSMIEAWWRSPTSSPAAPAAGQAGFAVDVPPPSPSP